MTEYPIIKNSDDYPETLSWDQFDHIGWKFIKDVNDSFYDNKNNRSSTSNAAEFVLQLHSMLNQEVSDTDQTYDQEGYVIYTSVDPDGKYRLKGSNDEWDDYQESIRTAADDYIERKAWSTGLLASSGFFWLCVLAALILIAFFAMERHQRSIKHLEEKKTA